MSTDRQVGSSTSMNNNMFAEEMKGDNYDNQELDEVEHHEGEIISEEVLHEEMLGDDVRIEYVDDGEEIITGNEVILDGNGEEVMEDEMATESLVALSQGAKELQKGLRTDYVQHVTMQPKSSLNSPRILRRPIVSSQRGFVFDQGTSRPHAQSNKPNFPVPAHTKRLLPVATLQPNKLHGEWRETSKRVIQAYDFVEVVPAHMRNAFNAVIERGDAKANRTSAAHRRVAAGREFGDVSQETAERIYKEAAQLDQQHSTRAMKDLEPTEYKDMPQLEEQAEGDNQNGGGDAQIDVEHYDSNDDTQISMQYFTDDSELVEMDYSQQDKMEHHRNRAVMIPEMRGDYAFDPTNYGAEQMALNQPYADTRYCPGCKLHLKRSIYYHHSRMIKKYGICNMFTPKRFPCGVPGCDEKLGTVEKLCEHMHQIHNAPTDIKTEVFSSQADFDVFLRDLEAKGGNFRMSRGNKMIKTGMVQYFRCNRTQAMAKDKTLRICDEVGLYGEQVGSTFTDRQDDPFLTMALGGKPQLRTEDACTAFFRKAFLPDGSIEVRYCDHHLHEDERLRLPQTVKERIYEMHRKKLQPAVILMVIQEERERFAIAGSAVERKLLTLTPKDISAVISTRNSNARKRNKARMEGRNIAAECDELVVDGTTPLNDTEQKCLEMFMRNESNILRDMAELKRVENRRRHLRESVRNNVFHLGRYIRTSTFSDLPIEQLDQICTLVKEAAAITRMKPAPMPEMNPLVQKKVVKTEKDLKELLEMQEGGEELREEEEMPQDSNSYDDPNVTVDGTVDAIDDSFLNVTEPDEPKTPVVEEASTAMDHDISGQSDEQEQIIVEQEEPDVEPPPKKKRGRRPKDAVVKEEGPDAIDDQDSATESPLSLPSRTRTGRVVKPSSKLINM